MATRTILSLVSTLARCGVIHVLEGILCNHDPRRFHHVVCTLSPEKLDSNLPKLEGWGVTVKQLNLAKLEYLVHGPQLLRHLVEKFAADVVHSHCFRQDILLGRANLTVPTVSTLHADLNQDYGHCYGPLAGLPLAQMHYSALQGVDKVVAVSEFVADSARKRGVLSQVIWNGIDRTTYSCAPDRESVLELRRRLGLPADRMLLLHNATLTKRKRPVEVVEAFLRSGLAGKALLLFSNEGPLENQCRLKARGSAGVRFLGNCFNVPDLLRSCDWLVSNSTAEGLPMAMLEACASGLRICATDIPPHQTVRSLFPEQFVLFDTRSPGALEQCFDSMPALNPGTIVQSPEKSLELISAARMSRLYHQCYDELCDRKSEVVRNRIFRIHRVREARVGILQ